MDDREIGDLVLVVEGYPGLCDLVTAVLELDPFVRTAKAEDGALALEMVQTMKPDLVVLDARPPRRSGLEVARRLKADPLTRAVPLVAITTEPLSETARDACDFYVSRPCELAEVVEKLRERLSAKRKPVVAA